MKHEWYSNNKDIINEFIIFPLSDGVIVILETIELPFTHLKLVNLIDNNDKINAIYLCFW